MTAAEFAKEAIAKFTEKITDEVFLTIESDSKLMEKYLRTVSDNGLDAVNQTIGKAVKTTFNLDNEGECKEPLSNLIQSYTVHKLK